MRISVNPIVSVEQRKIQRVLLAELTCTNAYPHCMDLLILWALFPLKLISLQGGKWGDVWLWRVQRMYSQRDLWSFYGVLFLKCVCVSCRDLAFWKSEPWGLGFDISLNRAGILEYEYGLLFNAFPKHPQEAQSLIYHSMSSPYRTWWGFMAEQCSDALLSLEVEMSWPGCQVELGMGNPSFQTKLGMLVRLPHALSSSLLLVASVWISGRLENVLEGVMSSWHIHLAWEVHTGDPQPSQAQLSLEAEIPWTPGCK